MPALSEDDLPRYFRALKRAIDAWYVLAAHFRVRLATKLRQTHKANLGLADRFTDDPDLPRTFTGACTSFQEALRELDRFYPVPADYLWLWCGEQTLTFSGPPPDLDRWLDS